MGTVYFVQQARASIAARKPEIPLKESMTMHRITPYFSIVLLLTLVACSPSDAPATNDAAPQQAPVATDTPPANLPPDHPPIGGTQAQEFTSAPSASGFTWETPEGWTERPSSGMRIADFNLPGDDEAECYVTRLGGTGGGLEANLNRWRGQVNLDPYAPAEIDALERIDIAGNSGVFAEMEGSYAGMSGGDGKAGYTLLGVVADHEGGTLFVKLTAPSAIAKAERENFIQFCASLKSGQGADAPAPNMTRGTLPSGHPPVTPDAAGATPPPTAGMENEITWVTPEGWTRGKEKVMRLITFHPQGNEDAECYIITLAGEAGGLAANVNRWRVQIGAEALPDDEIAGLPSIKVMGQESPLVEAEGDFRGMDGVAREGYKLLGIIRESADQSIFVKFTGPADLVEAEREAFISFCESLQ